MASAVVVGGGLGGLAAAIALEQAGYDVAVYEQAGGARREGGSITLWSKGTAALAALNVVPARVQLIHRMVMRDGKARDLLDLDIAAVAKMYGHPNINIWRQDLIADLTRSFAGTVHFDKRCVGIELKAESSVARFADGTTAEGDLVIGADGVHSAVRGAVWGGRAAYAGTTCWDGKLRRQSSEVAADTFYTVATAATFAAQFPMPDDQLHWFVDTRQKRVEPAGPNRRSVEEICGDWPPPFPALAGATDPEDVSQIPIYVRRPPRHWFSGRTVLLGDSADGMGPALGQGGSQAFIDAVALRSALSSCNNVEDALRRYQKQRAATVLRIWVGSNLTLRMRRTGLLELATRLTPRRISSRSFAASVAPDKLVREALRS